MWLVKCRNKDTHLHVSEHAGGCLKLAHTPAHTQVHITHIRYNWRGDPPLHVIKEVLEYIQMPPLSCIVACSLTQLGRGGREGGGGRGGEGGGGREREREREGEGEGEEEGGGREGEGGGREREGGGEERECARGSGRGGEKKGKGKWRG